MFFTEQSMHVVYEIDKATIIFLNARWTPVEVMVRCSIIGAENALQIKGFLAHGFAFLASMIEVGGGWT